MSKLPVANTVQNPASAISNIYQDNSNMVKAGARVLSQDCFRKTFSSKDLGSSSITLTIPRNLMVSNVLVHMQFKFDATNFSAGRYLTASWGFKAIRRIVLTYGGSEQLEISGRGNFERAMSEAETDRKKSALLELAGKFVDSATIATDGLVYDAVVPIYLPHSSVNAMRQIPFDAGLLTDNITIRLDLLDAETLWDTIEMVNGTGTRTPLNDSQRKLDKGDWYVKQLALIDSSASKADLVGPNSDMMYNYFFLYPQDYFSSPQTISGANPKTSLNVNLNGFRSGSVQSLVISVERPQENYKVNVANGSGQGKLNSWGRTYRISNLLITFGGNCIYSAESEEASQLLDLMNNHTDGSYNAQRYRLPETTSTNPAVEEIGRSYYYRVPIAQFSEVFRDYLQTGANISSDNMVLTCQIAPTKDNDVGYDAARQWVVHVQYIYQAALSIQKGTGSFVFNNPLPSPNPISVPLL